MISDDLANIADALAGRCLRGQQIAPEYSGLLAEVLSDLAEQARALEDMAVHLWCRTAPDAGERDST